MPDIICTESGSDTQAEELVGLDVYKNDSASIQRFLYTNEPPPEDEADRLRETLLCDEKRLSQLLERFSSALRDITEEHVIAQGLLDAQRKILSAVRCIPNEILAEIMSQVHGSSSYEVLDINEVPWALTRVCSRWRLVAASTPSLWSPIVVSRTLRHLPKDPMSLLQTALNRSGNSSLRISYSCWEYLLDQGVHLKLLAALASHASRWEHVHFSIPSSLLMPILPEVKSRTESLIHLSISPFTEVDILGDTFEDSPRLRSVSLQRVQLSDSFILPWYQLTSLQFHDGAWQNHLSILHETQYLESLTISGQSESLDEFVVSEIVFLPSLRQLEVCYCGEIFQYLDVPGLESVSIHPNVLAKTRCPPDSLAVLRDMIRHSGCSLQTLSLFDVPIVHDLHDLLTLSHELTELSIKFSELTSEDDTYLHDNIISDFWQLEWIWGVTEPILLPHLQRLKLDFGEGKELIKRRVDFLDDDFVVILMARWHLIDEYSRVVPTSRLEYVHIQVYDSFCPEVELNDKNLKALSQMKEEGLNISIRTGGEYTVSFWWSLTAYSSLDYRESLCVAPSPCQQQLNARSNCCRNR